MEKENPNFKKIKTVLAYILVLNWAVSFLKIFYGYMIGSGSITADGFHSFGDGANNIVGLVGITFAMKPQDRDHPYGHKKIENFTALAIAMMLLLVSIEVVESSVRRFLRPVYPEITIASFFIMLVTITVNIFVMKYEYSEGKKLKSDILISDSMHTRSDILISSSVIVGLIFSKSGIRFADPVVSLFVAFFITSAALKIMRRGSYILCDHIAYNPEKIRDIVMKIGGIEDCHSIRTRGREDDVKVDLRIHVDRTMHVDDAHMLSNKIEELLKKECAGVTEVIVHIEPERHK